MKIFMDTSSLFKLYHTEEGSVQLEDLLFQNKITAIYLSELTSIEFASAIWKRARKKDISILEAKEVTESFERDLPKYTFINHNTAIIDKARDLIVTYGLRGLRSLDSIQLATAVALKNESDLFLTSDKLLNSFLMEESLLGFPQ